MEQEGNSSKDEGADNFFKDLTNSSHKLRPRTPEGVALTKRQRDSGKVAGTSMVTGRLEGSRQKFLAADEKAFIPLAAPTVEERQLPKRKARQPRASRDNRRRQGVDENEQGARFRNALQRFQPGFPAQKDEQRNVRPLEGVQRGGEVVAIAPEIKDENGEEEVAVVGEIVDEEEDDQIMIAYRELRELQRRRSRTVKIAEEQQQRARVRLQSLAVKIAAQKAKIDRLLRSSPFLKP